MSNLIQIVNVGAILRAIAKKTTEYDLDWNHIRTVYKMDTQEYIIEHLLPTIVTIEINDWPYKQNKFISKLLRKCVALQQCELPDCYNLTCHFPNLLNLTHITFGEHYNQLTIIPPSITHLFFGRNYNQPTIIPPSVTHITFGRNYNKQTIIPLSVTHLAFSYYHKQVKIIPSSVTHLLFASQSNRQMSVLIPPSVTHLIFGSGYNQPNTIIPPSVTHLTFGWMYNQPTIIPQLITHLTFGFEYNQPNTIIPHL